MAGTSPAMTKIIGWEEKRPLYPEAVDEKISMQHYNREGALS
jgi:hypothetical protein